MLQQARGWPWRTEQVRDEQGELVRDEQGNVLTKEVRISG